MMNGFPDGDSGLFCRVGLGICALVHGVAKRGTVVWAVLPLPVGVVTW